MLNFILFYEFHQWQCSSSVMKMPIINIQFYLGQIMYKCTDLYNATKL